MKDCISSREMQALELNAEYFGVSRLQLMENAGHHVAMEVSSRFKPGNSVAVFCGLGGNGGDGFVAARHLFSLGFKVVVVLAGRARDVSDMEASKNLAAIRSLGEKMPLYEAYDSTLVPKLCSEIVIDALLGTGSKGTLRPPILQMVRQINAMDTFRLAVDVPTGIDADTGEVPSEAVKADLTVTFHKTKIGFEKATKHLGKLVVKDIGLPEEFERFAGPGDVALSTKPRPAESHKGDFGRLLVVGGSETYSGAPTLVALGAMRTGVDLVYVAAPRRTALAISSMSADLITIKLEGEHLNPENANTLEDYFEKVDAVAVGPGLGLHQETVKAVKALVELADHFKKPLLLDADGLKAFAESKRRISAPLVLTPHPGEYAILTGRKPPEDLAARTEDVRKTASRLGAVILLKGAVDIVTDGKRVKLNFSGNPGMTVGGTGDVLTGVVGAFLAQKVDPFGSAAAGAFINGAAGDFAFEQLGYHIVATDLIEWIPKVINDPMSHLKVRRSGARPS